MSDQVDDNKQVVKFYRNKRFLIGSGIGLMFMSGALYYLKYKK